MYNRYNDIDTIIKGTCEWLFRHKAYRIWAACDRGLFWIKGKPGSGKSTLLRYTLDNIMNAPNIGDSAFVLSFFFHGRGDKLQRTPLGLFRSLLHQVLWNVPGALPDLVDTYEQRLKNMGEPEKNWRWHQNELRRFFESSLLKVLESRPVWLFVDALDECGEEDAVELAAKFTSFIQNLPSTGLERLHICFSCRHYPTLHPDNTSEICLEHENGQDISTYVQTRLSTLHDPTASMIPDLITKRASGIFMWARLVVERVLHLERAGEGLQRIKEAVYAIPQDLNMLYAELVQKMDNRAASLKLILWICFAIQPLSLDELRWALVVDIVDTNYSYQSLQQYQDAADYTRDCDTMERKLKALSCGLAEAVPSSDAQVVQFIHQSVKDFFLEKGLSVLHDLKSADIKTSELDFARIAHYRLSRTCIRYLAMENISRSTTRDRDRLMSAFPLLHYAATSWITHVKQSETGKVSQSDLLDYFAWPSEALIQLWVRIYDIIEPYSVERPPGGTTMIHVVSRYQFLEPLRMILQRKDWADTDIDVRDNIGWTPLSWAVERGNETVVKLLLNAGAKVHCEYRVYVSKPTLSLVYRSVKSIADAGIFHRYRV
jgi:hypothetical protein